MKQYFLAVSERLQAMRVRELWLLFATVLIGIVILGDILLIEPINKKLIHRQEQIDLQKIEVDSNVVTLNALRQQEQKSGDDLAGARSEVIHLQEEIANTVEQIEKLSGEKGMISPVEMSRALESLLRANTNLKLVSLRTSKTRALSQEQVNPLANMMPQVIERESTVTSPPSSTAPAIGQQLYEHGITVEFTGSFLNVLNYLSIVEQLPWRFTWDEIEIKTEAYPNTKVRLELKTRSLSPGVMGV